MLQDNAPCCSTARVHGKTVSLDRCAVTRLLRVTLLLAAGTVGAVPVAAQLGESAENPPEATPSGETHSPISLDQVESALNAIESDDRLDDAVKHSLSPKYQQAIETLRDAERLRAQTVEYRNALESGAARAEELRSQLQALLNTDGDPEVSISAAPAEILRERDLQRIRLSELNDRLARLAQQLREFRVRPAEISTRIPQVERELRKLRKDLSSPELAPEVTSPGRVAERMLLLAQQSRLIQERENLEQELSSLTIREDLLEAEHELLKRQVEIAAETTDQLSRTLQVTLVNRSREIHTIADALFAELSAANDTARELAVEVRDLAEEFEALVLGHQSVHDAQSRITGLSQGLEDDYVRLQELCDLNSHGASTLQVLHRIEQRALRAVVDVRTTELPILDELQLASLQVRDKLARQPEVEAELADSPSEAVSSLLSLRRDLLQHLQQEYRAQLGALADLERRTQEYLDRAAEVRSDISAQLLGFKIRSSPPLSAESLTELPRGIRWLLDSDHWLALAHAFRNYLTERPARSLGLLLFVTVLFVGRPWIKTTLVACGSDVGKVSDDRFSQTLQAGFLTVLLAAPLPLLLDLAFRVAFSAAGSSDWMLGLSEGCWRSARVASFGTAAIAVCLPGGLGAVHFRWDTQVLDSVRTVIQRIMVVYLPAVVLVSICAVGESSQYFGSVGLFSFLAAHLWVVCLLWRRFSTPTVSSEPFVENPQKYRWSLCRLVVVPLNICLGALCVMACLGYLLTAFQLSQGLVWTLARVAGGVLLYFFTLRWFYLKQRRLMLTEAIARRQARLEASEGGAREASGEIVAANREDQQEMDLDVVGEKLRNMLRLLFGLGVVLVVSLFWTRIYPLGDVLDSISIPLGEGLTLLGLIQAALIVIVTCILVKSLPGVLELTFLRRTAIEPGTRTAIYKLGQYGIIAVGSVMVVNAVNVDWVRLGWIAAGLSVGLGFGLQEVVANFVCGLILLFERPIRVGDVVTIEGTTGTVTRINIRATTITNWDRQDLVVPNKNLITGTLLNWTLTASVNRITVAVGVAYGTDTEEAQQILLEVAADHPQVLKEPAPIASFEAFGESSLNLLLRAYLPNLDHRVSTVTELHNEIRKRFAAAGIEIPFPQRDLHLRQSEEGLSTGTGK